MKQNNQLLPIVLCLHTKKMANTVRRYSITTTLQHLSDFVANTIYFSTLACGRIVFSATDYKL